MKIVERIQLGRSLLKETAEAFGKRFDVSDQTVARWEKSETEAPYAVVEFCEEVIEKIEFCKACNGTGIFNKTQDRYFIALGKEGFDIAPFLSGGSFTNIKPAGKFKMIAGKAEPIDFKME